MGVLRWTALVLLSNLVFTGCVTQLQQHGTNDRSQSDPFTIRAVPADTPRDTDPDLSATGPNLHNVTDETLASYISDKIGTGYRIMRTAEGPLLEIAVVPGTDDAVVMAILIDDTHLALYQDPLDDQGRSQGRGITDIQGVHVDVLDAGALTIERFSDRSNGFHLTVHGPDRQGELYIIATPDGAYSVRTPYSTVNRTVLRDLTDDGIQELVQYSRIFEAGGRREIIIDAFEWDGSGFVHTRSLPVLRRVNERLRKLKIELEQAEVGETRFDTALQGDSGRLLPSEVFPALTVRVPELAELPLELGAPGWKFGHDIAIYHGDNTPLVYRVRLAVSASPYESVPVAVIGLD